MKRAEAGPSTCSFQSRSAGGTGRHRPWTSTYCALDENPCSRAW